MADIIQDLINFGQDALAAYLETLSSNARNTLESDILSQNFEKLKELYANAQNTKNDCTKSSEITPMQFKIASDDLRYDFWKETGEITLGKGQVAAMLIAGGQGSRLGFNGPKGIFDIGLPSNKSLFQIQAERLQNLAAQVGHAIPWCIMTSPLNNQATIDFFTQNNFFGYSREDIRFFTQGTICALDSNGKAILESENHLALVPDGNGGCFRALAQSGTLAWLIEKGVRYVFLYNVDNVLCRICDPAFIGALASNGQSSFASKVVHKINAQEKVGIFAYKNKKPTVMEYSDMPKELLEKVDNNGNLLFDGGNIGMYIFKIDALRKISANELPWHVARKTVCQKENCYKFEQFLFDAFPQMGNMLTFGVVREEEFAPVKNATGNDSPKSAREMLGKLHREWLVKAHANVAQNKLYEISPTISYNGEGLSRRVFERELGHNILEFEA